MSPARRTLENVLIRTPQEIAVGLLRLLLFLLFLIPTLMLRLIDALSRLLHTRSLLAKESGRGCATIPEALIRRPDPSIYSQWLLSSQGLPVTWNNPDIWVARAATPGSVEPDSYHLLDDTDYIVSIQVHNASTDPAIGVQVRLRYRPWSFNSPEERPVELDPAGQEVVRQVDISPMSSSIVRFQWRTPKSEPGQLSRHFCLRAELSHPLDTNLSNNLGQENTLVYQGLSPFVTPGQIAMLEVPLFNPGNRDRRYRLVWDAYEIKRNDVVELHLQRTLGMPRLSAASRLASSLPRLQGRVARDMAPPGSWFAGSFSLASGPQPIARTRYVGFEALRETILRRDYNLPRGMVVHPVGIDDVLGLSLRPGEQRHVQLRVKIPDHAAKGSRMALNIHALDDQGVLAGGVTVFFLVGV